MTDIAPDDRGYKDLAWAIIIDAVGSYHAYHCTDLRRCLVMGATRRVRDRRDKRAAQDAKVWSMKNAANQAERWLKGSPARYPFWLAAAWLGWDPDTLAAKLIDRQVGWNILVRRATTPANRSTSESERVAGYLKSGG